MHVITGNGWLTSSSRLKMPSPRNFSLYCDEKEFNLNEMNTLHAFFLPPAAPEVIEAG